MAESDVALEARARRAAKHVGWRLEKSRTRIRHLGDCGLYQLVDARLTS